MKEKSSWVITKVVAVVYWSSHLRGLSLESLSHSTSVKGVFIHKGGHN